MLVFLNVIKATLNSLSNHKIFKPLSWAIEAIWISLIISNNLAWKAKLLPKIPIKNSFRESLLDLKMPPHEDCVETYNITSLVLNLVQPRIKDLYRTSFI